MAYNDEARIQAAIVAWVRLVAPHVVIFAVPNGGLRSKTEAARMKWTGTLAGVPDLAIICGGRIRFLEVKTISGKISTAQSITMAQLVDAGASVSIVRSVDEARAAFDEWEIITRESVANHVAKT